ncbi:MAG: M23 family metallopeptidase [Chlorobi bacterium]|nr:M23 family metallopeptidase [Chlorobiota bacterium]
MNSHSIVITALLIYVIIPVLLGTYFLLRRARDRWTVLFRIVFLTTALPVFFYVPSWAMFWYPLRYIIAILFIAGIFKQFVYWTRTGWYAQGIVHWFGKGTLIGFAILFGLVSIDVFSAFNHPECVDVPAPLHDGKYVVIQGGSTVALNYHGFVEEQRFALDIVKMKWGWRASGIFPPENDRYYVWEDSVFSVCNGTVIKVVDSLPDQNPSLTRFDSINPAGNHVIVTCDKGFNLLYAHFRQGSIAVKENDTISKGAFLGLVGNSGNSTEPHLHIHAYKDSKPVALCIDGRWLVRNSRFEGN